MAIYAKVKGIRQGVFAGAVTAKGFEGQVQVNSLEWGVGNPFDVSTGQSTGRRVARPIVLTKPLDKSSPLFHASCVTNEALTIDVSYMIEGEGHKKFVTLSLTNAMIRDFNHIASFDGMAVEKISFSYTKIEFTWVDGGITSADDLMNTT